MSAFLNGKNIVLYFDGGGGVIFNTLKSLILKVLKSSLVKITWT